MLDYSIHFVTIQSVMLKNAHYILQVSKHLRCPLHSVTPTMVGDFTRIGCHANDIKPVLLNNQVIISIFVLAITLVAKMLPWFNCCVEYNQVRV